MKYLPNFKKYSAMGLLVLAMFVSACGADPGAKLNNQGNEAYTQEAYLEALELYQNAQIDNPELAEPFYNAANAFYREGQYDQALAQMQQALLYADVDLAQHSYFNLGNNFFNTQDLETAVQSYIEALLLNPEDADAKYNLELALNQQQQEEEQNQEENQDQQDQSGGEGEQEQENQDQSESEEGQNEEGQNGEQDQQQEGDQSQDGQEGDQENQNQNGEQDGQEGEGGDQESDPSQPGQDGEQQDQQNNGQAGQPGEEDGDQEGMAGLQPGEKLSQEQAKQLLAAIAGNSQTLQEKLGQILVVPGPPPAEDW